MDVTVGYDQQDEVGFHILPLRGEVHEDVDNAAEESRSCKLDFLQVPPVRIYNTLYTANLGLLKGAVEWKTMVYFAFA